MKKTLLALAAATTALVASPSVALADTAFNVGVTTDYRYRGISQSRLKPAIQGGVDWSEGGFYLGTWASSIQWVEDGGGKSKYEIDFYGGYKGELAKDVTFDVGVLKYVYRTARLNPSPNTLEFYGAVTFGMFTAKYSHSTSNLFGFANSKGSAYLDLSAAVDLGDGWTLTPHLGRQQVKNNGNFSYTDWSVMLGKDFSGLVVNVGFVGTNTDNYTGPNSKNLGKNALVAGLKYNF
jgi:uncharacterized protein (TIGR02001 family)